MQFLGIIFATLAMAFLTGCLGGATEAAKPAGDGSNSGQSVEEPDGNSGTGSNGSGNGSIANPPPASQGPAPGTIVQASEGSPEASYPSVGGSVDFTRNPAIEPNTDPYKPIIAIISQPAPYIPSTSGTIELWAADNQGGIGLESIQCSINDGAYKNCGDTVDLANLSEGSHTIKAIAQDYDGNKSGEVEYTFYVDTTPPTIQIAKAPQPATKDPNAGFQFQANDGGSGVASIQCALAMNSLSQCSDSQTLANLPEGSHTLYVQAVDSVGNTSPVQTHTWVVDNSAPVIQIQQRPSSQVYVNIDQPKIQFTVTDAISPNGIMVACSLNGVAVACQSGQVMNIANTKTGNYSFVIAATDALGNRSTATLNWQSVKISENRSTSVSVMGDRPVDILFVVDNSGSMNYERSNLAQRIDGMIARLEGLDWQIAVTSTDATNNNAVSDGRLIELIGLPGEYILDSSMDVAFAQSIFGNTVQNFPGGSGREEGIYSSKRVLDRFLAGQAPHRDFIRPNSDLSIVVLSDEDESSNGSNARIDGQGFINFVNSSFNGQKNMVFHSIIFRPGDTQCANGEGAFYGHMYDELSRLTGYGEVGGAIIGSVCEQDYTAQLADIGQSVKDLRNSIKLDCNPYAPETLKVSYRPDSNAAYMPYTNPFMVNGDRVTFDNILEPGDYKVDYQCRIN